MTFSARDLDRLDWRDVVAESREKIWSSYFPRFYARAAQAREMGDTAAEEFYDLLGAVTSLMPMPGNPQEPFVPVGTLGGRRSAAVGDFTPEALDIIEAMLPTAGDAELRARLADVLWVRRRRFPFAETAIDAYIAAARALELGEDWVESADRLERAVRLGALLGKKGRPFAAAIAAVEATLDRTDARERAALSLRLHALLLEHGAPTAEKHAALAEAAATVAERDRGWVSAREHWGHAGRWRQRLGQGDAARAALLAVVRVYIAEAGVAASGTPPNHYRAWHALRSAIEARRRAGGAGLREDVDRLHARLIEYQRLAVGEMRPLALPERVSALPEAARREVSGKPFPEALLATTLFGAPSDPAALRERITALVQQYPVRHFQTQEILNQVGKVIARSAGLLAAKPEGVEAAMWTEIIVNARVEQELHAGGIEEARRILALEHFVRWEDWLPLLTNHPFVPPGRATIYARGLHAGLTGDWLVATHLLPPQLENSLRHILAPRGVATSHLDAAGLQMERHLGELLALPETTDLLGEPLAFSLRALLVEQAGPNLRHGTAHGLFDDAQFGGWPPVYLWWLTLRFLFLPVHAELRERTEGERPEDGAGDGEATAQAEVGA